jgi:hypothetical protein
LIIVKPIVQMASDRAREKQDSREADRRALESGEKSREDLRAENGVFSSVAREARLVLSKSRLS